MTKPKVPRGAAREERVEAPAWIAEQEERRRNLPARRQAAEGRSGYVLGTANACRSCGMAVWLAGKDAGGRWVKVNLDGSAHLCGAPLAGLGRLAPPLALPGPAASLASGGLAYAPAAVAAGAPAAHAVADQGRAWVERFTVGVALVALVFLATIPRDIRPGPAPPRGAAVQPAAQRVVEAPARPEPPRKETFSLGSSEDEVLAVMGPPREIHDNRWWYGSSYVDFRNGRVVNFYNSIHGELKVRLQGVSRGGAKPAFLDKGLSKDEVLTIQGTPTRLAGNRWYYGSSYVDFHEDRVADYFNGVLRELKIPTRSSSRP